MIAKRLSNIFIIIGVLTVGCLFVFDMANTASQSGDINVQMTVPSGPLGGGGASDHVLPEITNVSSTVSYTTATVSWTATDNTGVQYCNFDYGLSGAYGSSAFPLAIGSEYSVDLSGLATGTLYYFSIHCVDTAFNGATVIGTFFTLSPGFNNKLFLIAKPEKRVYKAGGNLSMDSILYLYHPVTKALAFSTAAVFSDAGSSTVQNGAIPTGNFEAVLKGQAHLAKKIINVSIQNGLDSTLDFSDGGSFYLLAGDVRRAGGGDNFIDILDVSAEDIKFNSHERLYDLNYDGIIDVLDMSIILVNYNRMGDQT
jgi:hypothetical protein